MEQAIALASITFLAGKIIEILKYLRNKDWNAAFTLVAVWVAGIITVFLAAASQVTERLVLPGTDLALGVVNGSGLIFLGLTLSSLTSTVYDFKKALDGTDSAKQPPLLPPPA